MAKKNTLPSEEIQALLKSVYDSCKLEDQGVRQRQIRQWRRLKLLWEGFSQIWYSETAHDWRIWNELEDNNGTDQAAYDKPINVFRAYLESIIAALSVTVPPIKCYPDDADAPLDITTARAGDKIAQLVYRHNDAPLLWLHALFIFATEGMTAFYSYADTDSKYGEYEEKEYDDNEQETETTRCSMCGYELNNQPVDNTIPPDHMQQPEMSGMHMQQAPPAPNMMPGAPSPIPPAMPPQMGQQGVVDEGLEQQELNEFNPGNDDIEVHAALMSGQDLCPACMQMMDPEISRDKVIVTRLVGKSLQPKTRICIEVYGGLNVKIPNYAKKQSDAPYLILEKESNYVAVVEKYNHLHGNKALLKALQGPNVSGGYTQYDQWGRLNPQYQGEYPINVITESTAWLRPCAFNFLKLDEAKKLKKLYPDGAKVCFANDEMAAACNESLDDHWTLTENPLSDYLQFTPLGQVLVSVQEITNDLISLILQTIEHGIGQTFADPGQLNFNAYEQTEVTPGGIFPATPKSGKQLSDGFFELRTATLSSEVMPFYGQIQQAGQLASGATPSIFGGQLDGSNTASEYSMSRAQALQRLQNTWKLFTSTWKNLFGKVIPLYVKEVQHDERNVVRDNDGNFVNTFIRKAEMEGKVGNVELEANENLPMTWGQKKDLLMQLLTNQSPIIQTMLAAPENMTVLHEALGLVDFFVPGEDDIVKQYDEIKQLLNSQPIPSPQQDPMTGQMVMGMAPSIQVDEMMDNHQVEFEICRKWAISEAGREAKVDNQEGYQNVLLHAKEHFDIMNQRMMAQQQAQTGDGATPDSKANPNTAQEAPITGEQNVPTIQ